MLKNFNSFNKIVRVNLSNDKLNESVPVKEEYWEKKGKSKDKVALYFHDDLDGIYSAVVMKGWLKEKGFKIEKYGIVNYQEGWMATKLDPQYINIALDYAEDVEGIDVYMDHHGSFEEGDFVGKRSVKTQTGSAYEGICDQLGIPVDSSILNVIDMVDSAKYDHYEVDIKGILDFETSKFKNKLEFAASFNQMLKRSDHKTFIEVVSNIDGKSPSIYKIFDLFKKLYPMNNIDRRKFKSDFGLQWNEIDSTIQDMIDSGKVAELEPYMKDFVADAKDRLDQMQSRSRAFHKEKPTTSGSAKDYISSQKEFFSKYSTTNKYGKPKIDVPGYQLFGQLAFFPSGTWANALRARAIIEQDMLDNDRIPVIDYVVAKTSPIFDELKEKDGQRLELIGDIKGTELSIKKDFNAKEDVTEDKGKEGIKGVINVDGDKVVFKAKQPIFWMMLQYGNTIQVASYHDLNKYVKEYLPKGKDGKTIDNLGEYTDNLLKNMIDHFGYDIAKVPESKTQAGGHAGIGTVSNIFGKVDGEKADGTLAKKYDGVRFLDLIKNKMINDLSGIPWSVLDMAWNDPEERVYKPGEKDMDKKTMYKDKIRKIN